MPVIVEVIFVSFVMLASFFAVFLLVFLIALMFMPVEKSLSKMVWDLRAPKRPATSAQSTAGFKGFSERHR